MEIFDQLGKLFLQAVPTVILVFLFFLFLRASFFKPMERVLADRNARIEGVRRRADAIQAGGREKLRAYEEMVKKVRAEIYGEQEAIRRSVLDERAVLVREARSRANDQIRVAKERIAAELAVARAELERESQALAGEIVRVIIERRPAGDRKSTRLNSSHIQKSRMPSSA